MTEIDDRLKAYYRAKQLPLEAVSDIQGERSIGVPFYLQKLRDYGLRNPPLVWACAAAFVLALTLSMHQYGTYSERTLRTLNEAAMNHSTRLQLEFELSSIGAIDQSMSQLPFEVALPSTFDDQYQVLGARYCTLNGELAAHVKFLNTLTNKQASLFMTRSANGLQSIETQQESVDGVNVKLWNESGLFYAMASRAPL